MASFLNLFHDFFFVLPSRRLFFNTVRNKKTPLNPAFHSSSRKSHRDSNFWWQNLELEASSPVTES
ncbi:hypothetical protein DM860_010546 [Cuscuta australis]|uniref:Uncharacterized protein n=1 Tax=Cuscuta australis TaxID=267555 RepID=A0A328E5C8_9ASTE|nr:hypothetical protein DM860_010546 [Cuscuta australis]